MRVKSDREQSNLFDILKHADSASLRNNSLDRLSIIGLERVPGMSHEVCFLSGELLCWSELLCETNAETRCGGLATHARPASSGRPIGTPFYR